MENDDVQEINQGAVIVNGFAVYTKDYIQELQNEIRRLRDSLADVTR